MQKRSIHCALVLFSGLLIMVHGALANEKAVKQKSVTNQGATEDKDLPSREWLEFFAEFNDVDDEEFELILYHGLRDAESGEEDIDNE